MIRIYPFMLQKNDGLKSLLHSIDERKSSLESKMEGMMQAHKKKNERMLAQLEERNARIIDLNSDLDEANVKEKYLVAQLSAARREMLDLSKNKECAHHLSTKIHSLQSDIDSFASDTRELIQLFATAYQGFTRWKLQTEIMQSDEVLKLNDKVITLKKEIEMLNSLGEQSAKVIEERNDTIGRLEKIIEHMKQTAENADTARKGEHLSWEKAMEETKSLHRKELARIRCSAQDEKSRLNNRLQDLMNKMVELRESHDHQCKAIESGWFQKLEEFRATLSKVEDESALVIQLLAEEKTELTKKLSSMDDECSSLKRTTESLKRERELQQQAQYEEYKCKLEQSNKQHQSELKEKQRLHDERFQQKEDETREAIDHLKNELARLDKDKNNISIDYQNQVAELTGLVATERSGRINELRRIKSELIGVQQLCSLQISNAKEELIALCNDVIARKLTSMRQSYCAFVQRHSEETARIEIAHLEAISHLQNASNKQIIAAQQEAKDAKKILFQTIGENEIKLERETRHLREDYEMRKRALVDESRYKYDELAAKFHNLQKDFESLACADALKGDQIGGKDNEIDQLKCKVS